MVAAGEDDRTYLEDGAVSYSKQQQLVQQTRRGMPFVITGHKRGKTAIETDQVGHMLTSSSWPRSVADSLKSPDILRVFVCDGVWYQLSRSLRVSSQVSR